VLGEQAGVLDGLDQCISAGLLTEAGPGEYAFAHSLVRQTIYDGHTSARRMRLHRRLGEALEARTDAPAYVEALAHHFAEAAADGQATKAGVYALSCGRQATARLAYEDAAACYQRGLDALKLVPATEEERRSELLLALAEARWSSGAMDEAREACRLAAELADRHGDPEQLARAALGFAGPVRVEVSAAATGPPLSLLERALEALAESDTALRARVMGRLATALFYAGRGRRAPGLARPALEMARRVGDKQAVADVLAASYVVAWRPDSLDERLATATELARVATEVGDAALEALARDWNVANLLELGKIDAAERELATLNRLAEAVQQRLPRWVAATARAGHAHLEGRLEDYQALAHEALALGLEGQDEIAPRQVFGGTNVPPAPRAGPARRTRRPGPRRRRALPRAPRLALRARVRLRRTRPSARRPARARRARTQRFRRPSARHAMAAEHRNSERGCRLPR
jgi:hypothetical protein